MRFLIIGGSYRVTFAFLPQNVATLQMIFYQVVNAVRVESTQVGVGTQRNIVEVSWGYSNINCYNQIHLNFSHSAVGVGC